MSGRPREEERPAVPAVFVDVLNPTNRSPERVGVFVQGLGDVRRWEPLACERERLPANAETASLEVEANLDPVYLSCTESRNRACRIGDADIRSEANPQACDLTQRIVDH